MDEIKEESYVYKGNGYILISGNDGQGTPVL